MTFKGWDNGKLGDIVNFRRGHDLPQKNMEKGIFPVIGSNGVIGYHNEFTTPGPCITVGRSGNVGTPFLSRNDSWAHNTTLYIDDFKGNDPKFIYYFLQTLNLKNYAGGSAVPTLNRNHIHPINIIYPINFDEQKAIANILSSLDEKIEVNNQINKKLENMVQAIFKQWFVNFEFPNEEGMPYKSSGGEMVESELGMIPEGWKVGVINDIGVVTGGGTPSKKREDYYTDKGIPWITPKDLSINKNRYINNGVTDITEEGLKYSSAKLMPKGTVLFSSRAPIGYMAISGKPLSTNQGFKSVVPHPEYGTEFVYQLLSFNKNIIENHATGSTFKEISGGVLKQIKILLPSKELIANYNFVSESFGLTIKNHEKQISKLTMIRDTLLPKLMSGEIRVPIEE